MYEFTYFSVEWCDKKHLKVENELDIIQIWQNFTADVTVWYVVSILVAMLHNAIKCKILIILVALWHLYFVYYAKTINIDAQIRKGYNVIIKQHETKNASRKFTKSEVLIRRNHRTVLLGEELLEVHECKKQNYVLEVGRVK